MSGAVPLRVMQCNRSASIAEVKGARWRVDLVVLERNRVLRGWTRGELARHAHVDPKTLSTMFRGRRRPILGTVLAVSVAVGLGLEDVIVFDADARESNRSAAWCPL